MTHHSPQTRSAILLVLSAFIALSTTHVALPAHAQDFVEGPIDPLDENDDDAPPDSDNPSDDPEEGNGGDNDEDDPNSTDDPEEGPAEDEDTPEDDEDERTMDGKDVTVTAPLQNLGTVGGSVRKLGEDDLKDMDYTDPHDVLKQVSGLYTRQEDAFGLRPNIGLRGANSDRSKKVTLMEDGVLFGPAPYSAPAAYYFPMMIRSTGLEVFKGPGSVIYGPNTIGGALNLITRDIPFEPSAEVSLGYGMFNTVNAHIWGGGSWANGGILLEGVRFQSDGFKTIDGAPNADTGFTKDEYMLKTRVNTDYDAEVFQSLELKLGYSRETSNETYLGLTDADFAADPNRRYAASALDRMDWWRTQVQLDHRVEFGSDLLLHTTLYRHDFHRAWLKVNRFRSGPQLSTILESPDSGTRKAYYDVLTGAADSTASETLGIGTNDRSYVSQGAQTVVRHSYQGKSISNSAEIGLRVHYDSIERNHTEGGYLMRDGSPQRDDSDLLTTTLNNASTTAFAIHAIDQLNIARFSLAPGLRLESIHNSFQNQLGSNTDEITGSQLVLLPGFGAFYALTQDIGLLAGVHRGFSPVSPGQSDDVEPEFSINYEAGTRIILDEDSDAPTHMELVGFFSDYQNLTGECSFSAGCDEANLDRQFNAGRVHVYGLEALLDITFDLPAALSLPVRLSYTFTESEFQTNFDSDNPQFGEVLALDRLPYVPMHQGSLLIGLEHPRWGVNFTTSYTSELLEEAGLPSDEDAVLTDPQLFLDARAHASILDNLSAFLKVDNILGEQPIVSRRPFGARPSKPFMVFGGLEAQFGGAVEEPAEEPEPYEGPEGPDGL